MSTIHMVKCQGKTKKELIKALQGAIRELGGDEEITTGNVQFCGSRSDGGNDEEFEEVESPFANTPPVYGEAPKAKLTVVDNELDSEGIPWDSRIHASSKALLTNGQWRIKRGVSDAEAFPIKTELKARVAGATVQAPTHYQEPVGPVYSAPVIQQPVYTAPVQQAPVAAPAPQMRMSNGHTVQTFCENFPLIISSLITDNKIDQNYVNSLNAHFKIANIWDASTEQRAATFTTFVQAGLVQQVG